MLDPDMPDSQLRLHMGELTAGEIRAVRAAIRWANHCALEKPLPNPIQYTDGSYSREYEDI